MSSLFLWLHIGFAVFTIGPLTAATMAAPRAIRDNNLPVLRNLQRTTRIYSVAALGVFVFGVVTGVALGGAVLGEWYMTASMTLFIVGIVLLFIIDRDLRGAVHALQSEEKDDDAKVQNGRIAAISGLLAVIWLVILFLMVVPAG
jgi:protein-S-isoprenylcysteine O-methyltransferase Ste14